MTTASPTPSPRPGRARRFPRLSEAQAVLGWAVILVLVALLGAIYLTQTSRIAAVGRHVQFMQEELDTLKRENAALERTIAEAQSLEKLQERALALGFIRAQPEDVEYLIVPNYPAGTPAAPPPTPTPVPQPVETMGEALWLAAREGFGGFITGESP
ncbi:MAG: hypothetical protein AB1791_16405 [Chloroflexota bacterium]